jgi:hydroxymethylpyrimidine kinase/phosphomethylpyrimidine kinase
MKPDGVVSISAYDPSGGAGVGADLKVFACLGVVSSGAITSITPQTSEKGVMRAYPIPEDLFSQQLEAIHAEITPRAYKIGAVGSRANARRIAELLKGFPHAIVVDPVFSATKGGSLIDDAEIKEVADLIFPLATLVTPNSRELSLLTEREVSTPGEVVSALNLLHSKYRTNFLATGITWLNNEVGDILLYQGQVRELKRKAISENNKTWHGLGCALSSAIAVYTTFGLDIFKSILKARYFVYNLLQSSKEEDWLLRHGLRQSRAENAIEAMTITSNALKKLLQIKGFEELIPEVGTNVAMIPWGGADTVCEVVGLSSRIVKGPQGVLITGQPCLVGSSHMSRLVLELNKRFPKVRAAVNIRYSPEIVKSAKGLGLRVKELDRRKEPLKQKEVEGETLQWLAQNVKDTEVPDIIYDCGDIGKEPMVRILGENIFIILEIVENLVNALK